MLKLARILVVYVGHYWKQCTCTRILYLTSSKDCRHSDKNVGIGGRRRGGPAGVEVGAGVLVVEGPAAAAVDTAAVAAGAAEPSAGL